MAWSRVQGKAVDQQGAGTSYTLTLDASITAGDIVCGQSTWGTATTTDLTSVKIGTTSAVIKNRVADTTNSQSVATWYFLNAPSGTVITIAEANAPTANQTLCDQFTNTSVSTATLSGFGGPRVQGSPGLTTSTGTSFGASGDLIWACSQNDSTRSDYTAGSGFALGVNNNNDAGFFNISSATEWQTGTAAVDPSFSVSTNNSVLTGGLSFNIAGGADVLMAQAYF